MAIEVSFEFVEMTAPIGYMIGNALEIDESLDCLQNKNSGMVTDLTARLGMFPS